MAFSKCPSVHRHGKTVIWRTVNVETCVACKKIVGGSDRHVAKENIVKDIRIKGK